MTNLFQCNVNDDILEKFNLALTINKEESKEVIENFMIQYITNSFSKTTHTYKSLLKEKSNNIFMDTDTGKARGRIPKWAKNSHQINHKIVRAFYKLERQLGYVTVADLEKKCSDIENSPDTYVKTFASNFAQMKFDGPKSHGKVFEVENDKVVIWKNIKETLEEYKEFFIR
ncbi:hypothetical protein [Cytobacillus gottheilii]|uniref:hypothetical protein n=1 Tax=Cytobacillus gottheilii TaxID=859144 RepID=UPI0009B9CD44|nr:hypothetical protein [Cytobacillus gottheilii]